MENLKYFLNDEEMFSFNGNNLFCSPEREHVQTMKKHIDDNTKIKHRHSFICPPSLSDLINTVCNFDIEVLEVTDPKYRYTVWKNGNKRYNISQSQLTKVYNKIEKDIKIDLNKQLQKGRITRNKYKEEIGHRTLQEMANYFNNIFSYSRRKL